MYKNVVKTFVSRTFGWVQEKGNYYHESGYSGKLHAIDSTGSEFL